MRVFNLIIILVLLVSCEEESSKDNFPTEQVQTKSEKNLPNDTLPSNSIKHELTYVDSIWKLRDRDIMNCINPKIKTYNNEKLTYCDQGNGLELLKVEYEQNNIAFSEEFLIRNDQLIYAVEWEKRTANLSDDEASYWNCEYIIKDNLVVDHISLGMGKTEGESFDVQDIVKLWKSRKRQLLKLKN